MKKTDYTELDTALLARIQQRPANFTELQSGAVQKAAEKLLADGMQGGEARMALH